jgi:hypothetical protein
MDKALYTLHKARPGIGGLHCPSCNPAFGRFRGPDSRKYRQAAKRALRRTERQQVKVAGANELHQQLLDWIDEHNSWMCDFGMEDEYLEYNRLEGVRNTGLGATIGRRLLNQP